MRWRGYGPEENSWLPRQDVEDSKALKNYLNELQTSEKPAARLNKSSTDATDHDVVLRSSARLRK